MIDKQVFYEVLECLRQQMAHDKKSSELMAEAFQVDQFILYDNSLLIKQIINLLGIWFDKSELEHYIFDLNFGKPSNDAECEEIGQFYERITKE